MNYESWDQRHAHDTDTNEDLDWLCSYSTLEPVILPLFQRPRCSAMFVGSGLSTYPEKVYDSGVREVLVVDLSQVAVTAVTERNKDLGRSGFRCFHGDIGQAGLALPGHGPQPPAFDFVVDKGTLDCILAGREGRARAQAAIANMYNVLKTPGVLVLVSHSCPAERLELLQCVYWHDMKVKQVKSTVWEQLATEQCYKEDLVDWEAGPAMPFTAGAAWVYVLEK